MKICNFWFVGDFDEVFFGRRLKKLDSLRDLGDELGLFPISESRSRYVSLISVRIGSVEMIIIIGLFFIFDENGHLNLLCLLSYFIAYYCIVL